MPRPAPNEFNEPADSLRKILIAIEESSQAFRDMEVVLAHVAVMTAAITGVPTIIIEEEPY
jgi:hypothetical protein